MILISLDLKANTFFLLLKIIRILVDQRSDQLKIFIQSYKWIKLRIILTS